MIRQRQKPKLQNAACCLLKQYVHEAEDEYHWNGVPEDLTTDLREWHYFFSCQSKHIPTQTLQSNSVVVLRLLEHVDEEKIASDASSKSIRELLLRGVVNRKHHTVWQLRGLLVVLQPYCVH